jgi:hypothetical protein
VSTEQALYLIRSTLLTLNDANRSGMLRDLAAPDFQARNTAADLSLSFADLRRRNFDLYGAALHRRNSPRYRRWIKEGFCTSQAIFRRVRSRSISIFCLRMPPISGGCLAFPSPRRTRLRVGSDQTKPLVPVKAGTQSGIAGCGLPLSRE